MELWQGIHLSRAGDRKLAAVQSLVEWPHHADFDREAAMTAGELAAELTVDGQPSEVEDLEIAAIAIERNDTVLTRNVDRFNRIPKLSVEGY